MRTLSYTLLAAGLLVIAPDLAAQVEGPSTRAPRQSWTADRRAFQVGDVVTVIVDEYTLASANQGTSSSDRRYRDAAVTGGQSISATLPGRLGVDFGTSNEAESRSTGEALRQNRFQGEMTARVTSIEPSGLLKIEGTKVIDVDENREELTLTGWVRPQDVSAANLVDSWRIGDAEIVYRSNGDLGSPRGGFISRILGWLWP
ncbi:MAG TPA: flagellar basal body L-ring protein FlgH [Longimicrobiaceae bacterium]|nr:flagellar basal body L-ring protein FlgH [Longimicrobiaceae bacterium]